MNIFGGGEREKIVEVSEKSAVFLVNNLQRKTK